MPPGAGNSGHFGSPRSALDRRPLHAYAAHVARSRQAAAPPLRGTGDSGSPARPVPPPAAARRAPAPAAPASPVARRQTACRRESPVRRGVRFEPTRSRGTHPSRPRQRPDRARRVSQASLALASASATAWRKNASPCQEISPSRRPSSRKFGSLSPGRKQPTISERTVVQTCCASEVRPDSALNAIGPASVVFTPTIYQCLIHRSRRGRKKAVLGYVAGAVDAGVSPQLSLALTVPNPTGIPSLGNRSKTQSSHGMAVIPYLRELEFANVPQLPEPVRTNGQRERRREGWTIPMLHS